MGSEADVSLVMWSVVFTGTLAIVLFPLALVVVIPSRRWVLARQGPGVRSVLAALVAWVMVPAFGLLVVLDYWFPLFNYSYTEGGLLPLPVFVGEPLGRHPYDWVAARIDEGAAVGSGPAARTVVGWEVEKVSLRDFPVNESRSEVPYSRGYVVDVVFRVCYEGGDSALFEHSEWRFGRTIGLVALNTGGGGTNWFRPLHTGASVRMDCENNG